MTTYYKLTNPDGTTHGGCLWGEGIQHITSGEGELCGPGWTHWYADPLLAVLLDPIHGKFWPDALLWEGDNVEGRVKEDHGLKIGLTHGRTLLRIEKPVVSDVQAVAFGILNALKVYRAPGFVRWAQAWLDGSDRTAWTAEVWVEWHGEVPTVGEAGDEAWSAWSAWSAHAAANSFCAAPTRKAVREAAMATAMAAKLAPLDLGALARKALEYGEAR